MYGINEKSYWLYWDQYIQEEYKLLTEILGLRKQVKAIYKIVENSNNDLTKDFLKLRKEITNEKHLQSIENYKIEEFYSINYLKRFLLNANCMFIYAYCEGKLKELCTLSDNLFNTNRKIEEDKSRDSLNKYFNHLKNSCLEMSKVEKYLTGIIQQRVVRIAIAHHLGVLQKNEPFPIWDGLSRKGDNVEIVSTCYLEKLLNQVDMMFKGILISIALKNKH